MVFPWFSPVFPSLWGALKGPFRCRQLGPGAGHRGRRLRGGAHGSGGATKIVGDFMGIWDLMGYH